MDDDEFEDFEDDWEDDDFEDDGDADNDAPTIVPAGASPVTAPDARVAGDETTPTSPLLPEVGDDAGSGDGSGMEDSSGDGRPVSGEESRAPAAMATDERGKTASADGEPPAGDSSGASGEIAGAKAAKRKKKPSKRRSRKKKSKKSAKPHPLDEGSAILGRPAKKSPSARPSKRPQPPKRAREGKAPTSSERTPLPAVSGGGKRTAPAAVTSAAARKRVAKRLAAERKRLEAWYLRDDPSSLLATSATSRAKPARSGKRGVRKFATAPAAPAAGFDEGERLIPHPPGSAARRGRRRAGGGGSSSGRSASSVSPRSSSSAAGASAGEESEEEKAARLAEQRRKAHERGVAAARALAEENEKKAAAAAAAAAKRRTAAASTASLPVIAAWASRTSLTDGSRLTAASAPSSTGGGGGGGSGGRVRYRKATAAEAADIRQLEKELYGMQALYNELRRTSKEREETIEDMRRQLARGEALLAGSGSGSQLYSKLQRRQRELAAATASVAAADMQSAVLRHMLDSRQQQLLRDRCIVDDRKAALAAAEADLEETVAARCAAQNAFHNAARQLRDALAAMDDARAQREADIELQRMDFWEAEKGLMDEERAVMRRDRIARNARGKVKELKRRASETTKARVRVARRTSVLRTFQRLGPFRAGMERIKHATGISTVGEVLHAVKTQERRLEQLAEAISTAEERKAAAEAELLAIRERHRQLQYFGVTGDLDTDINAASEALEAGQTKLAASHERFAAVQRRLAAMSSGLSALAVNTGLRPDDMPSLPSVITALERRLCDIQDYIHTPAGSVVKGKVRPPPDFTVVDPVAGHRVARVPSAAAHSDVSTADQHRGVVEVLDAGVVKHRAERLMKRRGRGRRHRPQSHASAPSSTPAAMSRSHYRRLRDGLLDWADDSSDDDCMEDDSDADSSGSRSPRHMTRTGSSPRMRTARGRRTIISAHTRLAGSPSSSSMRQPRHRSRRTMITR
eukprot:PLAT12468.25.p1 GENE.PLAT12468.25~~PLAT12468.25.p1  ORF type:complete len:990 (-),score=415.28 PLAT12468.25:74-3010(-)